MARRGHEVVVITQHPDKNPNPNITEITIEAKEFNEFTERVSAEKLKTGGNPDHPIMEMIELQLSVSTVKNRTNGKGKNYLTIKISQFRSN